ncbi:MAG: hypothetical protein ACKOC1_04270 [Hyphomicrobiales bacterium]
MAEQADMTLPLLWEMRIENTTRHEQVISRLDRVEQSETSFKQALTADTLLSRLLTGEFEERLEALERKVRELEKAS